MDLFAALAGACVGALLTFFASANVAKIQRKAQRLSQSDELRRTLTVALVRTLLEFWECCQNPSANAHRLRDVESRLAADTAMFNANLNGYRSCCVRWYVEAAISSIRTGHGSWTHGGRVREAICEPLLKWSTVDTAYSNLWFEARAKLRSEDFTPEGILELSV